MNKNKVKIVQSLKQEVNFSEANRFGRLLLLLCCSKSVGLLAA